MNTVDMMKTMTEVNRHAKAVHSMDVENKVGAFLSSELQSDMNLDIKQEPNLEVNIKQETKQELDIKEEPTPILKQFAFIDANDKDTCMTVTPTHNSDKSLKIVEAYTLIDTEETSVSEVNEQKQGSHLRILKQDPDENEVLVTKESETRELQNAVVSKPRNTDPFDRCEYFCRICSEEFYTELKLTRHLSGVHKERPLKYRKNFGPLLTKAVLHKCGLCGKNIKHSREDIHTHLKQSHESDGLSLDTYHKRYMGGQWYNQCWFDCRKCQEKYMNISDLMSHIRGKHGFKKVEQYIGTLGPLMSKKNTHQCGICREIILCTKDYVLQHLSVHHVSLKEYNEKYLDAIASNGSNSTVANTKKANSENGPPRNRKRSPDSDKIFKCHSCHETYELEYFHDLTKTHRCKSRTTIPQILKPRMKELFQKCEYFCRVCPEEYYSREDIVRHIEKAHPRMATRCQGKSSPNKYSFIKVKEVYGRLKTKEIKHICRLCFRDVSHEQNVITRHLKDFHGVLLMTYYERFFQVKREGAELHIKAEDG